MKRIVLFASLCMFTMFSFAQKKAVKQAKSVMDKTAEARELIKPALKDAETAEDPETWKIAGDIEYKAYSKEREAEMLREMTNGKGANEEVMYTGLYNMVDYYLKADELAQLPDPKGKVKNKVRKDIVKNFKEGYPFFINGGIFYNDKGIQANQKGDTEGAKKFYGKAADFFEKYWDMPSYPIFEGESIVEQDSTFQTIKYYAVISAIQTGDSKRSIDMLNKIIASPYIPNSTHTESDPYELLSVEYQKINDSINFLNSLKAGAVKFPKNHYFTPNLINEYIRSGQAGAAVEYLDQAVKNDPDSKCELLSVKASLQANEANYEESIKNYQEAIAYDDNCERALEGLGVVYVLQAQDLKEQTGQITNRQKLKEIDEQTVALYQKSLPLLEKFVSLLKTRNAEKMDLRPGLIKLQNVYYNLSLLNVDKNAELEAIEKELE